jgi:hypothetical protein
VVKIPVAVVSVMRSCSLIGVHQRYEETFRLHLQGSNRGSKLIRKVGTHPITCSHNAVEHNTKNQNRVLRTRL